jgi:hypothetical protein
VVEHVLEVASDCNLFHREDRLAILDPQTAGALGEVACDQVDAEAEEFGYVESAPGTGDDLLGRLGSWLQEEVPGADAGIAC